MQCATRSRAAATHPRFEVYRDGRGKVAKLYRMYGSCFHSPGIYFEPDGTESDVIPERAVVRGSPEAEALQKRHDKQVGGLTPTDTIRCQDGKRLPP